MLRNKRRSRRGVAQVLIPIALAIAQATKAAIDQKKARKREDEKQAEADAKKKEADSLPPINEARLERTDQRILGNLAASTTAATQEAGRMMAAAQGGGKGKDIYSIAPSIGAAVTPQKMDLLSQNIGREEDRQKIERDKLLREASALQAVTDAMEADRIARGDEAFQNVGMSIASAAGASPATLAKLLQGQWKDDAAGLMKRLLGAGMDQETIDSLYKTFDDPGNPWQLGDGGGSSFGGGGGGGSSWQGTKDEDYEYFKRQGFLD